MALKKMTDFFSEGFFPSKGEQQDEKVLDISNFLKGLLDPKNFVVLESKDEHSETRTKREYLANVVLMDWMKKEGIYDDKNKKNIYQKLRQLERQLKKIVLKYQDVYKENESVIKVTNKEITLTSDHLTAIEFILPEITNKINSLGYRPKPSLTQEERVERRERMMTLFLGLIISYYLITGAVNAFNANRPSPNTGDAGPVITDINKYFSETDSKMQNTEIQKFLEEANLTHRTIANKNGVFIAFSRKDDKPINSKDLQQAEVIINKAGIKAKVVSIQIEDTSKQEIVFQTQPQ